MQIPDCVRYRCGWDKDERPGPQAYCILADSGITLKPLDLVVIRIYPGKYLPYNR